MLISNLRSYDLRGRLEATWPRRPLEAICTWIPGYSRLLISNLRSYDLQVCLEVARASEAVGGNMKMDTRVIKVADQMTSMAV